MWKDTEVNCTLVSIRALTQLIGLQVDGRVKKTVKHGKRNAIQKGS